MRIMNTGKGKKRAHSRHPANGRFTGSTLASLRGQRRSEVTQGTVTNISEGGFSMFATHPLQISGLLQGRLWLARVPAKIPTLVQVRWVQPVVPGRRYRIGLQYVI
ncbi:MAG: hypothetical protein DMG31_18225 [Acidobacteria bacterium]|nr:MAG: hypothetical protein DMG31_18225 [Acidobacteriota bacterium]